MNTDVLALLRNPLAQSGSRGDFIRLVLAESAGFGMPGKTIALLDDIAAMMGFYNPTPPGQAAHLGGPLINWRSHPEQPTFERVHEVEKLVFRQRALIAFGGAPPGHMVGTAEIVCAMGNIIRGEHPMKYFEVFQWASLNVLQMLTSASIADILTDASKKDWKEIPDDDVLKPGGRLYETYVEVATSIRREAIAALGTDPDNPRRYLRPFAAAFIESHTKVRIEAQAEGFTDIVERLDNAMAHINVMFPGLKDLNAEIEEHPEYVVPEV